MNLVLLGAPGAGKGTQAEILSKSMGIPIISTGAIIRAAVAAGTPMGQRAKSAMESGGLVDDETVIGIIQERLCDQDCQNGFILDGFPRTVPQAEALDAMGVTIDMVLEIFVADDAIERRMSGRRMCSGCGATYHIEYNPSQKGDCCEKCGELLMQRSDDHPDTVRERLRVYHAETEPLSGYYAAQSKLKVIQGQPQLEDTTRLVREAVEEGI